MSLLKIKLFVTPQSLCKMDGWHVLLCSLVLLYVLDPARSSGLEQEFDKNTRGDRQTTSLVKKLDGTAPVHVQRLYDAYRVRCKEEPDEDIGDEGKVTESVGRRKIQRDNRHPVSSKIKEPSDKDKPPCAVHIVQYESSPAKNTSDHKDAKSLESPLKSVEKVNESSPKDKNSTHNAAVKSDSANNTRVPLGKCILDFYNRNKEKKPAIEKPITQKIEGPLDDSIKGLGEKEKAPGCLPVVKYGNSVSHGNNLVRPPNPKEKSNNNPGQEKGKIKEPSYKEKPSLSVTKYDFTDDKASCSAKCPGRPPNLKDGNEKSSQTAQVIVLKLDIPEGLQPLEREPSKDSGERRILELTRIYNEILKAWHRPTQMFPSKKSRPVSTSGTVKLSALSDLLDVVEQLARTDLVSELAEKIGEKLEPNLDKKILHDSHLVTDSRASLKAISNNDLTGLFENMEPGNAVIAFKGVLADVKSRSSSIKPGGLYDEYKKGFSRFSTNISFQGNHF